jgi:hypothetical protein
MDLKVVVDTSGKLVVQSWPSHFDSYIGPVAGLLIVAAGFLVAFRLGSRFRLLAVTMAAFPLVFYGYYLFGSLSSGSIVHEVVMDRTANKLIADAFFSKSKSYYKAPIEIPLDSVVRADTVFNNPGGTCIVITVREGDPIYPFGMDCGSPRNEFTVLAKMQTFLGEVSSPASL